MGMPIKELTIIAALMRDANFHRITCSCRNAAQDARTGLAGLKVPEAPMEEEGMTVEITGMTGTPEAILEIELFEI